MDRQFMKAYFDILARRDLTMTAKVVYTVLCHQLRGRESVRLGYEKIAGWAGAGRTAVVDAVAELAEKTDLEVERSGRCEGRANTYWLPASSTESDPPDLTGNRRPPNRKPAPPPPESDKQVHRNPDLVKNRESTTSKEKTKRAQAPTFSWEEVQPRVKDTCLDTPEFAELWVAFVAHREQMKAPLTAAAVTRHLKTMLRHGLELSTEGLGCAIDGRWKWFQPEWLPSRKAPGSGAPADRPERVRCTNGRYDNIGTILE